MQQSHTMLHHKKEQHDFCAYWPWACGWDPAPFPSVRKSPPEQLLISSSLQSVIFDVNCWPVQLLVQLSIKHRKQRVWCLNIWKLLAWAWHRKLTAALSSASLATFRSFSPSCCSLSLVSRSFLASSCFSWATVSSFFLTCTCSLTIIRLLFFMVFSAAWSCFLYLLSCSFNTRVSSSYCVLSSSHLFSGSNLYCRRAWTCVVMKNMDF